MVSNLFLILGLDPNTSWGEVEAAFQKLMKALSDLEPGQKDNQRLKEARRRLREAFEHYQKPDVRKSYQESVKTHESEQEQLACRPKLGQLLVAAGVVTLPELDAVLEIQQNTKHEHIPIGELMVGAGYITKAELEYYLHQQELILLPLDHPERWGQRLIELGLINDDQLKVALIDQQATSCTLREAFINRGWLTAEELDRIF